MWASVTFESLIDIYRHADFDPEGKEGTLSIATEGMLDTVRTIDRSIDSQKLTGIAILDELEGAAVGSEVRLRIGRPARSLGVLAGTFDDLLLSPKACSVEPDRFFVREGGLTPGMVNAPAILEAYRKAVALKDILGEAAAYLDPVREELMFVGTTRVPIPIRYDAASLRSMSLADARSLVGQFGDDVHKEQKLSILANAVVGLCSGRPADERFRTILSHCGQLVDELRDGYRLLVSEFSYANIRRDVETAQFDYLNKIHKTFTDIQGQLLGIPVATFVVASQLKRTSLCDADFWTDAGVIAGAWIFVVLLLVAITNQWLTLDALKAEVEHQRTTVEGDYAAVADRFADVFKALRGRIRLHRTGLVAVALVAVAGASLATFAFHGLVSVRPTSCLSATEQDGSTKDRTAPPPPAGAAASPPVPWKPGGGSAVLPGRR